MAAFIRRSTTPGDRVLMAGANPEVYWLAERRAASRYFSYFIPLRDPEAARQRMADLERNPPRAIGAMVNGDAQADLPALQGFIGSHHYRLAFELNGAQVWLRS